MPCHTKVDFVDIVCLLGHRCLHAMFLSSSHGRCCGLLAEIVHRTCGVFSVVICVQGCNAMKHGSREGALRIKIVSVLMSEMVLPRTFPELSNVTATLLAA